MSERIHEAAAAPAWWRLDRDRLAWAADGLVVVVAITLPWSTSATAVAIVLWLIALVPTLDAASVRREVMTAAGGLPLLAFGLAAIGMLWADASWSERLTGLRAFDKLLLIPLLLAQFRRSPRAHWVILGFLASASILLLVSLGLRFLPGLTWRGRVDPGVPVKDYITQSGFFAICILGLLGYAVDRWRGQQRRLAAAAVLAAGMFLSSVAYTATGRTALVAMIALLVVFLLWFFGWKGVVAVGIASVVVAASLWLTSTYLRDRVTSVVNEVQAYQEANTATSSGLRLEYWRKARGFIAEAPLIGQGTGSIRDLFRQAATGAEGGAAAAVTVNPHNQIIAVAIQLGLVGTIVLVAMWIAHLALFWGGPLISWLGLVIVLQNIVSSQFNSHLFDFTQGWLYVFGLGVAGGTVLQRPPDKVEPI
jgi:hypothetical protein